MHSNQKWPFFWNCSETTGIESAASLMLMAWCYSTRASAATISTNVISCSWESQLFMRKQDSIYPMTSNKWSRHPLHYNILHIQWATLLGYVEKHCSHLRQKPNNSKIKFQWLKKIANSLWHCDAIWWHRSGSTLTQIMACCLTHQAITWTNVDFSSVKQVSIPWGQF